MGKMKEISYNINNENIFFQISFLGLLPRQRGKEGVKREGKVTSRLHFPIFCGGGKKEIEIPSPYSGGEEDIAILFSWVSLSSFFSAGGAKKTQGMTLWFLQNREQGSISILGKRLLTRNKNRLCSKTCGVDEKQNLAGGDKLFFKKLNDNSIKRRAGSHPKENL